jgi:hypothetical protein
VSIITSRQIRCFCGSRSSFSKKEKNPIELEIDGQRLTQPCEAAESFAAYFKSVASATLLLIFGHLISYVLHLSVTQILCSFVKSVFSGSKCFPKLLETVGLRVLNRKFRGCSPFNFDFEFRNCPSAI